MKVETVNPSMPAAPVANKPFILKRIWVKVCEIAKKIFNFFYFWKKPTYVLSDRQINIIEKARENARQMVPIPPPQPTVTLLSVSGKRERKVIQEPVFEDPSLKRLLTTLTGFTSVVVNCLKIEKIAPSMEDWKESAESLPDKSKVWVKMFMDVKKYLDPIFARFTKAEEPLIMPLIQLLCTVLLEKKKPSEIEEALAVKINELLSKKVISEELHKRLISTIQPAISWIIQSNNLLLKSIDPIQLHELFIDTRDFALQLSKMLLSGDLDEKIGEIQKVIQEHLETSLPSLLEKNKDTIAKLLGSRIADLIQNLPYISTFDDLTDRINNHLDAWVFANGKRQEEKKTIRATRQAVDTYPSDIDQSEKIRQEEYLAIVEKAGGEKAYLEKKFLVEFREFFALKNPDGIMLLSEPPPGMNIEMLEEAVCNIFAEKVYRLLLPTEKRDLPFEIFLEQDGLAEIWERISLPEPLKEIEIKLEELFETILKSMKPLNEQNFKAYFFLILKTIVIYYIRQNKVMPVIQSGIQNIFEKYSKPASIQELFSENIIPTAMEKIFELFARQVVFNNLEVFAPLFCSLIEAPENKVIEAKKKVIAKIEEVMSGKFIDFNWEMMDRTKVPGIVQPIIVEITQVLQNLKALDPTKTIVDKEVAETIKKYYVSEKVESKKEFGEIINKLLFNIGDFNKSSWSGWLLSFFPGTLAQVATAGFKDYRASYHTLVNTIVGGVEANYLKYENVKTTFFSEERSEKEAQAIERRINKKLPGQFQAIASETHDLLSDRAGGYFIPETKALDDTIKRIFRKLFKRSLINKNLLYQIFTVLNTGFDNSVIRSACNLQLQNKVNLITEI